MKVLTFLIGSLGGGGAERVTIALGNYFCEKGYEVNFIAFSKENNNYDLNQKINRYFLPENNNKRIIFSRISLLKKFLKKQSPDYVISLGLGYQYLLLGNLLNKYKFILSERNAPQYYYKWYEKIYVKYCYRKAYKVVFQTQEAQDYFGQTVYDKSKIIANPITSTLPLPYDGIRKKTIVSVNRLSKQKNIFMLLRSFKRVLDVYPEYNLEIYGKGEQKDELERYAEYLGINTKVKFMGQKKDVHSLIVDSALFVSSSDYEGMSNSMLEAMAIGLPVICTNCPIGGAAMVIQNGVNGILTKVGDEIELANAMIDLINNPKKAKLLGKNASKIRDDLNVNTIAKKWEDLLFNKL